MMGFLIGIVVGVCVSRAARRGCGGRWRRRWSHRGHRGCHRCHGGSWDEDGRDDDGHDGHDERDGRGGHRGRGGPIWLRIALRRLDATPEQRRVIRAEIKALRDHGRGLKKALRRSRGDLAEVLRADSFDEIAMGGVLASHDEAVDQLRHAFVGAVARVHTVLSEEQRTRLADMLASGPSFGPYRGAPDDLA